MRKFKSIMQNPYTFLLILILITGCTLYAECIWGDKILAYSDWGYDTKHSFLPAYEAIAREFFNHDIKLYDFSYGFGTTWAPRMMLMFDPFAMVTVFVCVIFPKLTMGTLLVYMQFFKEIVGGELCLFFLKQHKLSDKSSVLAAYIFSFCGYMMATGQHYYFSTFLVLAALLLVAIDRYISKGKFILLIFASGLIANMGPYVAFQIYLMAGVYTCIRINLEEKSTKRKFYSIFKTGLLILAGLLVSMPSFLLQSYDILKVSRRISDISLVQKIKDSFFWVPSAYIKTGILRFFSSNLEGTVNNWNGVGAHFSALPYFFSTLFILCMGQFLFNLARKGESKIKTITCCGVSITFLFSFFNAFIPELFNVFAGLEYRYVFIWLPFFALMLARTLDDIYIRGFFSHTINFLIMLFSLLILSFMVDSEEQYVLISKYTAMISVIISAIILSVSNIRDIKVIIKGRNFHCDFKYGFSSDVAVYKKFKKNACFILLAVAAVELLIDNRIILYADRSMMTEEIYLGLYWDRDAEKLVNYVHEIEGDNFVRLDRTYLTPGPPDVMLSALYPYRSASVYNSTINKNLDEFSEKFFPETFYSPNQLSYNTANFGAPFDLVTASNLGIKYLITNSQRNIDGWSLVKACNDRFLYKNDFIQTAGLVYHQAISQSEFEQMPLSDRKTAMSQVIVLEDQDLRLHEYNSAGLYYEKVDDAIIQICNGQGGMIEPGQEDGAYLLGNNAGNVLEIELNASMINNKDLQPFLYAGLTSNNNGQLSIIYNNGYEDMSLYGSTIQLQALPDGQFQEIYVPVMQDTIKLKIFCYNADIKIHDMGIYSNVSIKYGNDGILWFENENMGNVVRGQVELAEKALLMMPIVFEDGWHAYVDGKEEKISRADYGFMAVELEGGMHDIVFEYKNPVLKAAVIISCIGWVSVCCLIFFTLYQKRQRYHYNSNRII